MSLNKVIDDATCKLNEERGLVYKKDFIQSLSEDEYKNGLVKTLIPGQNGMYDESIWVWISPEDKLKYLCDDFGGTIKAITCNVPIMFMDVLCCFTEIDIDCRGDIMPIISDKWLKENILDKEWYKELWR